MNNSELIKQLNAWLDDEDYEKIISTVHSLPDKSLNDEILGILAASYNYTKEYKKAMALLKSIKPRSEGNYRWHFHMGYALYLDAQNDPEPDSERRIKLLDKASSCFVRCLSLNPPEYVIEECDTYLDMIEDELDELSESNEDFPDAELYDEEEINVIEEHIKNSFGEYPTVYHEIYSPDVHIDICLIPPTREHNFYTLVTMGMGAHIMNIPKELPAEDYGRVELMLCLPPDWKIGENDEEWFWPIALLKSLARLPLVSNTWLGWGHSVDNQQTFAANTKLCGSMLINPTGFPDGNECELPCGDKVCFYEVIPIYREEMEYKEYSGTDRLLRLMRDVDHVVDISRPNCCEGYIPEQEDDGAFVVIDSVWQHADSIREKELPVDEINAANHMAIYLRWCIEHELIAPDFCEDFSEVVEGVRNGTNTDLRQFIFDSLHGMLLGYMFGYEGMCFASYYYRTDMREFPYRYPADVDDHAERFFGSERYNSGEFKDEGYLFVPFDERYYTEMSEYIERAYNAFLPDFAEHMEQADDDFSQIVKALLGCPVTLFNRISAEELRQEFLNAAVRGKSECFTPLMLFFGSSSVSPDIGLDTAFYDESSAVPIIAEIPVDNERDILPWFCNRFGCTATPSADADKEKLQALIKKYGTLPSVIDAGKPHLEMSIGCGGKRFRIAIEDMTLVDLIAEENQNEEVVVARIIQYLGCKCKFFPPSDNDSDLQRAYKDACERGKAEGFVPVMIAVDKRLLDNLLDNSPAFDENGKYDAEAMRCFREELLSLPLPDGESVLEEIIRERREAADKNGLDWNNDIVGDVRDGEPLRFFPCIWEQEGDDITRPIILAEIPVKNPWEVFAYVPFGGDDVPTAGTLMAVARYWYEEHKAVPAAISHWELNFAVPRPVSKRDAIPLAVEIYALCPCMLDDWRRVNEFMPFSDVAPPTAGQLADGLKSSTVWELSWEPVSIDDL